MALAISDSTWSKLKETTEKAVGKVKDMRDAARQSRKTRPIRSQLLSGGGAGIAGYLEGRYDEKSKIAGMPLSAVGGGLAHALAFMFEEKLGDYGDWLHDVAQGAVDLAIGTKTRAMGREARDKKAQTGGDGYVGRELNDEDYLRRRVRE